LHSIRNCTIGTATAEVTVTIFTGANSLLVRCWIVPLNGEAHSPLQWIETVSAKTVPQCAMRVHELIEARDGEVLYVKDDLPQQ
jgi:hypothetical protein